jgi:hypothetical protein
VAPGTTIDEPDRELLRFLALHRATTAAQVPVLLKISPRRASERLRRLEDARLLRRDRIFAGRPATVTITRRGLREIGSELPPPRVSLTEYRHDVGVSWLWLAARDGVFGHMREVVAERELRAATQPVRGLEQHRADLQLTTAAGKRIAVELELTAKSTERLDRIMLGFAGDPQLDAVLYLVPDAALARRIGQAAQRAGIADMVRVQRLAPDGIHGAPNVDAEPARSREAGVTRAGRDRGGAAGATRTGHDRGGAAR